MNGKALDRRIKQHIIAGEHDIFLPVIPGLEEAALAEMSSLGLEGKREEEPGSLLCRGSLEDLWKIALMSRTASRLYLRLASFQAEGFREMRTRMEKIPWELYLSEGCAYRLRFSLTRCRLHVTDNIAKTLQRSIRDRFEQQEGRSPGERDIRGPHTDPEVQTILIRGYENRFTLSLDGGGGPLYDRGYRPFVTEAPLRETLAASLLILAGLSPRTVLMDPMCGSGTFTLEASGMTAAVPVNREKVYPFAHWPSFRPARYEWLIKKLLEKEQPPCLCLPSDRDGESRGAAQKNWGALCRLNRWEGRDLPFGEGDFFKAPRPALPPDREPLLILNPPYGLRLPLEDRLEFFQRIGRTVRETYRGVNWGIIAPGLETEKALGLHWERKYLFKNGGLPVSFLIGKI